MEISTNNIRFYTVATSFDGYLNSLLYTLPQLHVLALGRPWRGYISKLEYLQTQLLSNHHDNDIVVFCDAYDVLFNAPHRNITQLVHEFNQFNVDILFSVIDYSNFSFFEKYYVHKMFYGIRTMNAQYICNGGLFMGKRAPLLSFISHLIYENQQLHQSKELDDDRLINRNILKYAIKTSTHDASHITFKYADKLTIGLDIHKRIFHNHLPSQLLDKIILDTYQPPTDIMKSQAFFYHFIANQNIDRICQHYHIPYNARKNSNSKFAKFKHYITYFKPQIAYIFIIIVASIILLFNR